MSLNSFSALVVALHANALVSFAQPATHGAPSAIFALPIPSPSTWSNEFSCFIAQVTSRTKAATAANVVRAKKKRKEVARINAGRASKRQEAAQLIKDHKDLLYLAQGIQAGMPKGNGVPLTHMRCMVVGRRVAGPLLTPRCLPHAYMACSSALGVHKCLSALYQSPSPVSVPTFVCSSTPVSSWVQGPQRAHTSRDSHMFQRTNRH